MPWIEGIGDEVTIFFSIVIAFCILAAAWFSTGIRDIPFISVMIVQLTRRRRQQESAPSDNVAEPITDPDDLHTSLTTEGDQEAPVEPIRVSEQQSETEQPIENVSTVQQLLESATEIDRGSDGLNQDSSEGLDTSNNGLNQDSSEGLDTSNNGLNQDSSEGLDTSNNDNSDHSEVLDSNVEPENLSSTELRKRRLEFLSGGNKSCDTQSGGDGADNKQSDNQPPVIEQINTSTETQSHSSRLGTSANETQSLSPRIDTSENRLRDSQSASYSSDNSFSDQTLESEEGAITVKIKFLNDTQRQVEANLNETIGSFRRRHFPTEISESKLVRFIYNGQDLRNDASTLQSYNIGDNSVLHCLITQPRQEEHPAAANIDDNGLDIGVLMFPLFGLLLSIVWYARFVYRQIFNVTSTLTLSGITFLYLAALLSSLRGPRVHEHVE